MIVATHNGTFHADEVFALAALGLAANEEVRIIRTRDKAELAAADLRIDIGRQYNPKTGDFDHHQRGGAGARENGIRYASFGLIWHEYGEQICGSSGIAARIDSGLVQTVDANDNGQQLAEACFEGVRPMTVDQTVAMFNPTWDADPEVAEGQFDMALAFAGKIIEREVIRETANAGAISVVEAAIDEAEDARIIILNSNAPWKEVMVTRAPKALFVVYAKQDSWGVQAVPRELGTFDNRKDLPEAWAGKSDNELAAITGVEDAVFCHTGRFIAVAKSQEGALRLAELALAD